MTTIPIYQIDAFSNHLFGGNPAAVCVLQEELSDEILQSIAAENNLSETAFISKDVFENAYKIRWFTPMTEVDLCGHATLAAAKVIFGFLQPELYNILFYSASGTLKAKRDGDQGRITINLPAQSVQPTDYSRSLLEAMKREALEVYEGEDALLVYRNEATVRSLSPDFEQLKQLPYRGIIATAAGDSVDFVCRFFAPRVGINEDPVTGSAFTKLVPFWAGQLKKTDFRAWQLSERGGEVLCDLFEDRVYLSGEAVVYLKGEIYLES